MAVDPSSEGHSRGALLERSGELAALDEMARAAASGRGAVTALVGAAGIGKTSLLAAARRFADDHELLVLSARGGEFEQEFPFGVVRQLLERPLRELPEADRAPILEGAAAAAGPALGLADTTAAGQFDVVHGLYWACVNLAARRPVLLCVDDVHWADGPSLRFLSYLARRTEELPLALLVAMRPGVDAPHAELLDGLIGAPGTRVLEPAPLSESAVGQLVSATFGAEAGADLVRACREATVGNPFLCHALLAAFGDRARAPAPAELAEVAARSISARVVARLGRLPGPAIALARAVAVLGAEADLRHAVALAGLSEESGAAAADVLAAQGLMRVGQPLEFVHPLVRAAVAGAIPPASRLRLHGRAARVLAEAGAEADAVAGQLMATDPAADPWAVEWLERAGALALRRGAPEAAAGYLERARLEGPPTLGLLCRLARALIAAGDPVTAAVRLEQAQQMAPAVADRAAIAQDQAVAMVVRGDYAAAAAVVVRALQDTDALDADVIASFRGQLLQIDALEPGLGLAVEDRLPDIEDPQLARSSRGSRDYLAALATHGALRLRSAADVMVAAQRAVEQGVGEELTSGALAWPNTIFPTIVADGFDLAEAVLRDAFERTERTQSVIGAARGYAARTMLHLRRGRLREAVADGHVGARVGGEAGLLITLIGLSALLDALVEQGDLAAASAVLSESGLEGELDDAFLHNWVLHARGRVRLAQGDRAAAIADFEECLHRGERRGTVNPALTPYRSSLALALPAGDRERAGALAEAELALARRWGARRTVGMSLRRLALTRPDHDEAVALLRESVEVLEPSGAVLEHAHSLTELGAALRRQNLRADAREPLYRGMELAHACGASPLVVRARAELVATGARPRRIMRSGVDALTASELRVARLAADGLTNPEIAQTLYVTPRTVELHLTHAYQKLDIAGRAELGRALNEKAPPVGRRCL